MPPTAFALATLQTDSGPAAAIKVGPTFFPLSGVRGGGFGNVTVKELLQDWDGVLPKLQRAADAISTSGGGDIRPGTSIAVDDEAEARILTPVQYPDKLLAVGANYAGHLAEMGLEVAKWGSMPFFMRPPTTSLVGPGETVRIPRSTKQFDWECELAVVVGRRLRHASRAEAAEAIAGYTIGLDLSCRDLIPAPNELKIDLMRGKAQDTMAPCGPWVVPKQFMPDVDDLRITLAVNGKKMMDASTSQMLYKCDEQLAVISEFMTLVPGDIVFTGSPSGSAGVHENCWLKPGDLIQAEIEGVGPLAVRIRHD